MFILNWIWCNNQNIFLTGERSWNVKKIPLTIHEHNSTAIKFADKKKNFLNSSKSSTTSKVTPHKKCNKKFTIQYRYNFNEFSASESECWGDYNKLTQRLLHCHFMRELRKEESHSVTRNRTQSSMWPRFTITSSHMTNQVWELHV